MSVDAGFEVASAYVTLLIADGDFEAMVTEKIEAACSVGGATGGDVMTRELAGAAAKSGDEIESALLEAVAGSGDAMAVQIGDGLSSGLTEAASRAGDEAGIEAGGQFSAEFDAATAGVGADLGDRLVAGVDQVAPHVAQVATGAVGEAFAAGMTDALAASTLEAGALSKLSSSLADAAAEAGGVAGVELSRNLTEAAVMAMSDEEFAAFTDALVASASTAGTEAGVAAAETLGASFSNSLVGVDLIAEGLSTAGQSMKAGAQAAAEAAAEEIAQVEESTLTGVQAYEAELDAVFESIWRGGQGMTVQLAAAMTEAFQGIEADTTGFTDAELAIFSEFYQRLDQMGDQAALSFAERIRLVQQEAISGADIMASGMSTIGLPMPGATPAAAGATAGAVGGEQHAAQLAAENAAAMGEMGAAADTAEAAVGGLGAAMGGPLMWGLLGVASMLPMVSGLFNSGSQAAQAYAQQQSQLEQAIAQDSNMIGAQTVSTIANQLATSGAADTLQSYGVSLSDATAAMAGVHSAQKDVNGTLNEQIDNLQALIQEQSAHSQGVNTDIESERQQVQQLEATRDAMHQLEQDTVNAVQHNNDLAQATLNAERAADVYNVQVRAGVLALQQQAQTAKVNADALGAYDMTLTRGSQAYTDAVNNQMIALANNAIQAHINADALNQSLPPQAQLSGEALQAAINYQQASTATSAYTNALTAMYGQYGDASSAQAQFTIGVDGLKNQITGGKDAVNGLTDAGAKNIVAFDQMAKTAEGAAEKIYQTTNDSQQADTALQGMATKLDAAAKSAHLTDAQIAQLNIDMFGVPDIKDIHVHLDPTPAEQQMAELDSFIKGEIDSINATPITPQIYTGGGRARVAGGPVQAGQAYIVGEQRAEVFVPESDGYVYPSVGEGRKALGSGGGGPTFNFYGTQYPTGEQMAILHRELATAVGA